MLSKEVQDKTYVWVGSLKTKASKSGLECQLWAMLLNQRKFWSTSHPNNVAKTCLWRQCCLQKESLNFITTSNCQKRYQMEFISLSFNWSILYFQKRKSRPRTVSLETYWLSHLKSKAVVLVRFKACHSFKWEGLLVA